MMKILGLPFTYSARDGDDEAGVTMTTRDYGQNTDYCRPAATSGARRDSSTKAAEK